MESAALPAFLIGGQLVGGPLVQFRVSSRTSWLLPAFCGSRSLQKKKHHLKKTSHVHPKHKGFHPNGGNRSKINMDKDVILDRNEEMMVSNGSIPVVPDAIYSVKNSGNISPVPNGARSVQAVESSDLNALARLDERDHMPGSHLQDLLFMIRTAEQNIRLLNEAHMCAIGNQQKLQGEKEDLQEKVYLLEMKMVETDARLKLAEQEKAHMVLLEKQLENLHNEMSNGYKSEEVLDMSGHLASSQTEDVNYLSQELSALRTENMSLKDELHIIKDEIRNLRKTDKPVDVLEKDPTILESSLEELELEFAGSGKDSSKVSCLELECKNLHDKVEYLQGELAKVSKPDEQTAQLLQQNQELCERVEQLVEFLNDAKKIEKQNELLQHKIRALDEFLEKSDEEIHSHILEYKDSVMEFQDALSRLKKENSNRKNMETTSPSLDDCPWEFWSSLLMMVDGWFLEKKISLEEVNSLRDMIWRRKKSVSDAYMSSMERKDGEMISSFRKLISSTTRRLHVIHIAAEMAPVAKVGGLGDVVTGLSKALQEKGHFVEVILPKYDCMNLEIIKDLKALELPIESYFDGQIFQNKIFVGVVEGLPVYLIEPHHPDKFFWRGQVYGEHDDFRRFSFFSRAALELLLQGGKKPDIIHCHDWQTAFVAPLYWDVYVHRGLNSARICFTFHNIEYQGSTPASALASCGLDVSHLNRPDRMQDNFVIDRVNPVKGAIVFSNIVTTVSPSYAKEVLTPEGGRGLQSTLNLYSRKFVGILNGIDTDAWDPATDPFLKVHFNSTDVGGKAENKGELRRYLGLSSANIRQPLVACITRLVPQKGTHLIRYAIFRTLQLGGQFVLLGSSPVSSIQREFEELSNQFNSHEHARLVLKYDESLAHLIFAASDMYIIPSLFEPCGLTQMIAMRYGALPIARKTGGLGDSVFDVHDDNTPVPYRNGFTFFNADEKGLDSAMERAFDLYNNDAGNWKQLVQKVMNIDFSWGSSAIQYEELYQRSVARGKAFSSSVS